MVLLALAANARAGSYYVTDCSYYRNTAPAFQGHSSAAHLSPSNECMVWSGMAYRSLEINEVFGSVLHGYGAQWSTTTPSPAITIVSVYTPPNTVLVDCTLHADGFTSQYFWGANGQNYGTQPINYTKGCRGGVGYADGINRSIPASRNLGWQVACGLASSCRASDNGALLAVNGIDLEAQENTGPSLNAVPASNLWYHSGWVRGTWPITLDASDPSGVCNMETLVDGQPVAAWIDSTRDRSSWTQCHGYQLPAQLDTTNYPTGHMSLTYTAGNAAGVGGGPTRDDAHGDPVLVDNQPVALTLSGPSDAPSTAGTQYVTATATAGPSGVAGIVCSTDGSPSQWHAGSSISVPVQGLGQHTVSCSAQNHSVDPSGNPARSPTESRTLSIRQPSVSTVSFTHLVDALRCARRREQVHVPAHWVTVHYHGRWVHIKLPAETRTITVMRCHPRLAPEHGAVLPHMVHETTKRVAHRARTTISGWLGTAQGDALGGQRVRVLTAPDNGQHHFSQVAAAITAANGSWTARLPAGPSRLVVGVYDGSPTVEPSRSQRARLVVPASVTFAIHPHSTHWGDTIQLHGRLWGGYVPPAGEVVVLWIGWPGGSTEIGHLYAARNGRFQSPYTFLRGNGTETYELWAQTAKESDYPYAPRSSRRVAVTVRP